MDVLLVVIDSFGIGALPDAALYGDEGANTALHVCESVEGEKWPFLQKMGLGNASSLAGNLLPGCPPAEKPLACFAAMAEKSPGKDTTTGHWELAGILLEKPFTTFPPAHPSFPEELSDSFLRETGCRGFLGNCAASGTEIIQKLGQKHIGTGFPIIYTSSDSVLQIASHEDVIPVDRLYEICEKARKICDRYFVGRVIARPFTGSAEKGFTRTEGRHDYSIALPGETLLDRLQREGVRTIGVGKIGDIFNMQGICESFPEKGNNACLERLYWLLGRKGDAVPDGAAGPSGNSSDGNGCRGESIPDNRENRFIFVNLVDTDMHFGHRRDVRGYFDAVSAVDRGLEKAYSMMKEGSALIITADHGCDPSFRGSDHTREYVPLLACVRGMEPQALYSAFAGSGALPGKNSLMEKGQFPEKNSMTGKEFKTAERAEKPDSYSQGFGITESFSFASELLSFLFKKNLYRKGDKQ